jgi:hypothetical protein
MKPEKNLEKWSTCIVPQSPYLPPEVQGMVLKGYVEGDEKEIRTSPIISIDGSRVETMNTVYILGEPDKHFIEFCKEAGCHVPTKDEPIRKKKRKK